MRLTIDTESKTLTYEEAGKARSLSLYSSEAFEILSHQWLINGWNQKYTYSFSWCGRPIIQLPEDMVRIQEVLYQVKPDVVVETGVAHGGSLIFYASLFKARGKGKVIGVDIEIRPHNRKAIESHELFPLITLIEGNSVANETVTKVKDLIKPDEKVLILLDSCHTRKHVLEELEAYHSLVTSGSYIVATDGIMKELADVPRGNPEWRHDNPSAAALEFVASHPEFHLEQPKWPFCETELTQNVTHWPNAWLRRD